ncbi:MAG: hypothetical protein AAF676_17650, partial [Pseudomonadota bacterium]
MRQPTALDLIPAPRPTRIARAASSRFPAAPPHATRPPMPLPDKSQLAAWIRDNPGHAAKRDIA